MRGADLGELGEDGGFEGGDLWDGFDDEVNGGKVVHFCGWEYPFSDMGGFVFGDAVFGDVFFEELVWEGFCQLALFLLIFEIFE